MSCGKLFAVSLVTTIVIGGAWLATEPVLAQSEEAAAARKAQAAKRRAQARRARQSQASQPAQSVGGWQKCEGVLFIDTLCQLPDGRVCIVDEEGLFNCQ